MFATVLHPTSLKEQKGKKEVGNFVHKSQIARGRMATKHPRGADGAAKEGAQRGKIRTKEV